MPITVRFFFLEGDAGARVCHHIVPFDGKAPKAIPRSNGGYRTFPGGGGHLAHPFWTGDPAFGGTVAPICSCLVTSFRLKNP